MGEPNFTAQRDLATTYQGLKEPDDTTRKSFDQATRALLDKLLEAGYSASEISAAEMVAIGSLTIG